MDGGTCGGAIAATYATTRTREYKFLHDYNFLRNTNGDSTGARCSAGGNFFDAKAGGNAGIEK